MSTEEWRLQVSFKTPAGTLINVRAATGAELGILLGDVTEAELATQVSSIENMMGVAHTLAPLGTTPSTPNPTPQQSSQVVSAPVASPTPVGHMCKHGERKYVSGNGAKGPWAMWACPTPKGATDKCDPDWIKLGS